MKLVIIVIIFTFIQGLKANDLENKKTQISVIPWTIQDSNRSDRREIPSSTNFQILYSPLSNFFFGITYGLGQNGENSYGRYSSNENRANAIYQFDRTKQGETFAINSQYFFTKGFFVSLNLGIERGFTVTRTNYINYSQTNIILEPFAIKSYFSDRSFSSLGLGYKFYFWENFIFAIEAQQGYMEAGKINHHVTFDPTYYKNSLPKQFQDFIISQNFDVFKPTNSLFSQVIISAGIAF